MTTAVNDSYDLYQPSASHKVWILWLIVSFFYAFQNLLRVSPSVMMTSIVSAFDINPSDIGHFSAAYYLGYALMHVPIGLMLDRIQLRWVLTGSIFMSVIGMLPLIYLSDWHLCVIGRFLVGAGSSGAILSLFNVTQKFFPEHLFSRLLGIGVTIGVLGAIYGSGPVDYISQKWGWQNVLLIFFAIGLLLSLAVLILAPNNPERYASQVKEQLGLWSQVVAVFTNKRVLFTAFFAALMVGPIEGFADVWALPFLEIVYHYDRSTATSLPPLIFLGMCIGSPLLSAIAERYKVYDRTIIICGIGMAIVFSILLTVHPSVVMVGIMFTAVGIFSAYQVLVIYVNSKNIDMKYGGLVTAITNMIIMSFGSVFHFTIPKAMDWFTKSQTYGLFEFNQMTAYHVGISVIPICLIVALLGFIGLGIKCPPR